MILYGRFGKDRKNYAQYVVTKRKKYNGKYEINVFMMLPEEILENMKRFNELFDCWDIRPAKIVELLGSWYLDMKMDDSYRQSGLVGADYSYSIVTEYLDKYERIVFGK